MGKGKNSQDIFRHQLGIVEPNTGRVHSNSDRLIAYGFKLLTILQEVCIDGLLQGVEG